MTIRLVFIIAGLFSAAMAGFTGPGPCSMTNNHLDPASFKFISECSDQTFCSNGTCKPRLCRRDEFPFGYDTATRPLPPLCSPGFFCPDEGNGCQPLLPSGGSCQLNRDEQCAPPQEWRDLANPSNFNGSICLRSACMTVNAALGQSCVKDTTTYADISRDGERHNYTISRDNCRAGTFCHDSSLICVPTKLAGSFCTFDVECSTRYCGADARCAQLRAPLEVPAWQSAIVIVLVLFAMLTTCILLNFVHTRHKHQHEKELREYYMDQLSLRRAIIALHTAAAQGSVMANSSCEDYIDFRSPSSKFFQT